MEIVQLDTDAYQAELNATAGRGTCGIITKTLRAMRIGQKWFVPAYISMATVKSTCSLIARKDQSANYVVHNNRQERSVTCVERIVRA
jgi:hypothetical protein